jgi:hypothetical protein
MKYYIDFLNIKNDEYRLEFITPATGSDKELKLTNCEISWEGKDDIFEPLKISGLTATLWTDGYLFDLYQAVPVNVQCVLYKGENIYWQGFVTPNVYNQPAYEEKFELSIDAVDSLSILEFFPYKTDARDVRSFKDIITNCFNNIPQDLTIEWPSVLDFSNLYISEQNFFSEEDEAWTCQEVLEEIARYCNLTIVQIGAVIKFLDYDTLDNEIPDSIVYTGATVSLADTYNKISIESNLYNADNYLPKISEDSTLIIGEKYEMNNQTVKFLKGYVHYVQPLKPQRLIKANKISLTGVVTEQDTKNFLEINKSFGANFLRYCNFEYNKSRQSYNWEYYICITNIAGSKFTNPIYIIGDSSAVALPSTSFKNSTQFYYTSSEPFGFGDGYLCLNFSTYLSAVGAPFPTTGGDIPDKIIDHSLGYRNPRVQMRLKVGEYYLQADKSTWSKTSAWFECQIGEQDDQLWNNWHNLTDTVIGEVLDFEGLKVKVPDIITGILSLEVRAPYIDTDSRNEVMGSYYQPAYILIKDVTMTFKRGVVSGEDINITLGEEANKDIKWETVIDENNILEFSAINQQISTASTSKFSFSDVITKNSGSYEYLATVDKGLGSYPMEQYKLNSYYEQLKAPRKQLDITLKGLHTPESTASVDSQKYVINASAMDLLNNQTTLNIVEKG